MTKVHVNNQLKKLYKITETPKYVSLGLQKLRDEIDLTAYNQSWNRHILVF